MDNTLYVGLSHQMAMRRHMDVIANNLANMNTTAFKKESVLFRKYLEDGGQAGQNMPEEIAFVYDLGISRNYKPGEYTQTGNPLDIALTERGFLEVQADNGDIFYTRNGHLQTDEDGRLVTQGGEAVLDNEGAEIVFGPDDEEITIAGDGTISSSQGQVGRLSVVEFAPDQEQSLRKAGNSLYRTDVEPEPATTARVLQGKIESSNVEPIQQMTQMIQTMRAYQSTERMLQQYQKLQSNAFRKLAKVQ